MSIPRLFLVVLPLASLWACSGGGGGTSTPPQAAWGKFRHDTGNSGAAVAAVATNNAHMLSLPIDVPPATPGAISSSPAIAEDGTVYVGSEGGTLAVLDANLGVKARLTSCAACPGNPPLGALISSPAVYMVNNTMSVLVASRTGSVYVFYQDAPDHPLQCTACFRPNPADFGADATINAAFVSSPSFTTDPVIFTISGIFIGASIEVDQGGSTRHVGKLYAINTSGILNWQFPRPGDPDIGPVTSSPALGDGNSWYFTAADGYLYALTSDGSLKWKTAIGAPGDLSLPFAPSVLTTGNYVVSPTASGEILAISADQLVSFHVASEGSSFTASLAAGGPPQGTPTTVPGPPGTPTATPTLGTTSLVYGVTQAGHVVGFDVALPTPTLYPTPQTPIPTPVISSPALSSDGFLVFGSLDGQLHIVNTITGGELFQPPITLADGVPIRSSPSISANGVIYVGADNGVLYAVGLP